MPLLLAKLPDADALQRLLDAATVRQVAREPGVFLYVVEDDGQHHRVLVEDPR